MLSIRKLKVDELDRLNEIDMSYESETGYRVYVHNKDRGWSFELERIQVEVPFTRDYDWDWSLDDLVQEHAKQGYLWVAEDDGNLVGLLEAGLESNDVMKIHSLYISKPYRQKGVGGRLLAEFTRAADEEGVRGLTVETQVSNGPAIDFYRSHGFEVVGVNYKHYSNSDLENWETAVFLHKDR